MNFRYENNILNEIDSHKHFGVILSSNNKWTKHIDFIIKTPSMKISYPRNLEYQLLQNVLNKLYCTYERPVL